MTRPDTRPDTHVRSISDPETLRLIADPLRLRLLELIRQQPRTVTELADLLDAPRTKLYYHVKLLEEHDLIAVDTTRVVSGITEKRYRVTAYRLTVDKAILGDPDSASAPLDVFLSVILDEVATEIRRSVDSGLIDLDRTHHDTPAPRSLTIGRSWYAFDEADVARFRDRFEAFRREFEAQRIPFHDDPSSSKHVKNLYEWLTALYPVLPPDADEQ
jgi:DNA-binding transcriptional ArsR family regulator